MRKFLFLFVGVFKFTDFFAQDVKTPDKIYGELFKEVQLKRIFSDNKTFVDCVPKRKPADIMYDYGLMKGPKLDLKKFVEDNFQLPVSPASDYKTDTSENVVIHIKNLWKVLKRDHDPVIDGSTLLPLPNPYIVPGGRFREIYYWDSYFTLLGLKESGENEMIENMVSNFAFLISQYGHIPNGNRSYYLSRSQPPFFALMLDILASVKGNYVYATYLPALQKEYEYFTDQAAATKHVIKMPDGSILQRYYDRDDIPRQESYREDAELVDSAWARMTRKKSGPAEMPQTSKILGESDFKKRKFRDLRSAAESGWDFSSRWFADGKTLAAIQVTNYIPVDLNCLLYHLEKTLAKANKESGELVKAKYYDDIAERRRKAINKYCWSSSSNWYVDYNLITKKQSPELTLAGMSPFFLNVAGEKKIITVKEVLEKKFLKAGGLTATLKNTGEQWDAPNGWAPLMWIAIAGLENYNQSVLAKEIAKRWVGLNTKVFKSTGKLMEKYNVVDTHMEAGGGEYQSQDGFGWTNGVLITLIKKYNLE
ncbi:MAG: trehalase [Chitinophagaceae bacterium]|nr:trehalase [Chitinophagaceae bacterium]